MRLNKKQKQRISKLLNEDGKNKWYGLYCFFDEYEYYKHSRKLL